MSYQFDYNSKNIIQGIVHTFDTKVRGKKPSSAGYTATHDGKYGHWLEEQMGITPNSRNEPDLLGFEMKNYTANKTTFGDWSADYYLFKDLGQNLKRHEFMTIFGQYNDEKDRYSWSGKPFPKYGYYNDYGQTLLIDSNDNILILYSYAKDKRSSKETVVPNKYKKNDLLLAMWKVDSIKRKLESKFKKLGWFKCLTDSDGIYNKIVFGGPLDYSVWLSLVREGTVYLDSGMYSDLKKPNIRPYSNWRANNKYWDSMILEKY